MVSNRNALKKYAPQARLDFIQAMTNRAAIFGITKSGVADGAIQGELFILNGKAFPRSVAAQRDRLAQRIKRDGFDQVMETIAYTWFNRFLAIRYMEVHDYFDHGLRVLSHPAGHAEPQILEQVTDLDLPGLNREELVTLKLDGTKDEDIYRKVIIAQCNDLHRALPFLFERIDDETELLLPSNLLQSDSIVRKLVDEIEESEWNEIEIIGWLYQFYISEKKDQVIGKVVRSEDIPAATQLFTPNWIVKYMVQNSLGAQWLATYPNSTIRGEMEYYIAPAEQAAEVQAQIDAIKPKQLDPEAITLIDPAVGSGHILVEAYELFRAIYLERGYTKREAARAILTKNLFGVDIDDRAAQMAGFALLMKACADDRSVLRDPPVLNVLALQDSGKLDADALAMALLPRERFEIVPSDDLLPDSLAQPTLAVRRTSSEEAKAIKALVTLFDGAKTFGSLITVPAAVTNGLPLLEELSAKPITGDLLQRQAQSDAQEALKPLILQACQLGRRYNCVVANPPYMGGKGMNAPLKAFTSTRYPDSKADLFAAFIERSLQLTTDSGSVAMIAMQSWMFLSSYEKLRIKLLKNCIITSMAHLGARAFDSIGGEVVSTSSFVLKKPFVQDYVANYVRLVDGNSESEKIIYFKDALNSNTSNRRFRSSSRSFQKIPGSPIAYWAKDATLEAFEGKLLADLGDTRRGLQTGNKDAFIRMWFECDISNMCLTPLTKNDAKRTGLKWFMFNNGGDYRKWYGNLYLVVDWLNDGYNLKNYSGSIIPSEHLYFMEAVSWSRIASTKAAYRANPYGVIPGDLSPCYYPQQGFRWSMSLLNSKCFKYFIEFINPTITAPVGDIAKVPVPEIGGAHDTLAQNQGRLITIHKNDWDQSEISWNYSRNPLLILEKVSLLEAYYAYVTSSKDLIDQSRRLEEENNIILIDAFQLRDSISKDVELSDVTINCNPHFRYAGDISNEERESKFKSDTMRELVSYALGCVMGRYSLAEPGLIYANAGGEGFDWSRYGAFRADDDGIIPLTEEQWFADDAATKIEEFLDVAWPNAPMMETLTTLLDGLAVGKADEPRSALRAYLSKQFYKDHLQTYKNRPIYWLFSSGKQKAFEALVYLHRYNEGTLARMRTNYVSPLMGKLQQRMSDLDSDIASSASSAEKARKAKEKDKLGKQLTELRAFDEELRHLADQRIALDLDDGVKVNYGRFGNLLAAKDKVCGKDE